MPAAAVEGDVELDAVLDGGDACEEIFLLAVVLDVGIGRGILRGHQLLCVGHAWKRAREHHPVRAVDVGREPNAESHGNNANHCVARRLHQAARGVGQVTAHLVQVFDGEAKEQVGDEADDAEDSVALCDVGDGVLTGLHHLVAECQLEFVREGRSQPPVDGPCDVHSVTLVLCHHRLLRLNCLNQLLEPLAFGVEHTAAQRRKAVVAAAGVVELGSGPVTGLLNQVGLDQPLDRAVQRGRPEADFPGGALQYFLHDPVAVLFFSGEGQHDMEPLCFKGKEGLDPRFGHVGYIYQVIYIYIRHVGSMVGGNSAVSPARFQRWSPAQSRRLIPKRVREEGYPYS